MDGPTDVDALAEALRVDGVVVDRVMGSGEAQESEDRIAALIREVPFPVYVALVEQPDGLPDDTIDSGDALAGLLNRRLGDGLYVLDTTQGIPQVFSFGLGADPNRLSLHASANRDAIEVAVEDAVGSSDPEDHVYSPPVVEAEAQVRAAEDLVEAAGGPFADDYPATISDEDAAELAERAVLLDASASWRPDSSDYVEVRTVSPGFSALVGVLAGLVVALLLGQSVRGWPRHGRPRPAGATRAAGSGGGLPLPTGPDLDEERTRAVELVEALGAQLEATDWDRVADRDVAGRALAARDAAEPLLDSRDVADLLGAQVLARSGSRDLRRGRRGRGEPLATCYFDPRHPDATSVARWRLGDGYVEVPCCEPCGAAVVHDGTPQLLRLQSARGLRPYWERDDVWARTGYGSTSDFLARDVLADRVGER